MGWINKIGAIFCVNLTKRGDRLLQFVEQAEQYEIPFQRYSAIEHSNGAIGLKETMVKLFTESLEKGYEHVLVFEDDCLNVEGVEIFHDTMNKVVSNLPENYVMIFLGCQLTGEIKYFHSPNLIKATRMYSTHAVLYSKRGMMEALSQGISHPIDNWYVSNLESLNESYAVVPLLCSQRAGFSNIGHAEIDWSPFIIPRFNQKINEARR
jgi:GR25 family glycosyltransferase involved in LPS biosynthesis